MSSCIYLHHFCFTFFLSCLHNCAYLSFSWQYKSIHAMEKNVDRISDLPDSLLLSIISSLPTTYAVSTSILSRRWKDIWVYTPYLDFDENHFITTHRLPLESTVRSRFVDFVHCALLHYKGDKLSTFRLWISYRSEHYVYIDQWIGFLIKRRVQELDLDLWGGGIDKNSHNGLWPYELPNYFFTYGLLSVLKLNFCTFKPPFFKIFALLKTLSLTRVELSSELFLKVMTSCLVLEILHLERCYDLKHLKISDSNLRLERLTINQCRPLSEGIDICTPKLRSFKYFGHVVSFHIEKMPCLHDVVLDFGLRQFNDTKFGKLLTDLDHVKDLTICSHIIQGFMRTEFLDMSNFNHSYWGSQHRAFDCMLHNLKSVDITGITGWKNEIELLEYIIKNAMVLEKLIINLPKDITSHEANSIISRLQKVIDCAKGLYKCRNINLQIF
ncbi:hypothetical protein HHK36_013024 [Tetracentron sinense]|uniref:F-box domain-containing protein n=1 Tax=Tetracentron sinense TaxID=13715 RepID=A0A834Z973_TETSI|nr:hypothetical protein HHK36_013024 [Tetracentron sinense]